MGDKSLGQLLPFTPTLGPPTQSRALSTHPRPSYPYQTSHTHSMPSRSVPVPPHPLKALYTHPNPFPHIRCPPCTSKSSIPISDPPHTPKAPYTHRWSSTPNQSPHIHFRPSIPILGLLLLGPSTDGGVDNGCLTEWADGWFCACVGVGEIGGWVLPSVSG